MRMLSFSCCLSDLIAEGGDLGAFSRMCYSEMIKSVPQGVSPVLRDREADLETVDFGDMGEGLGGCLWHLLKRREISGKKEMGRGFSA